MATKLTLEKKSYTDLQDELKSLKEKKFEYKIKKNCLLYGKIEFMGKDTIVNALSKIIERQEYKERAAKELGLDPSKVKSTKEVDGHTIEEWKEDFKTRLSQIKVEKRIKKLEDTCPELLDILPDSDKRELVLDKLNSKLSEDDED